MLFICISLGLWYLKPDALVVCSAVFSELFVSDEACKVRNCTFMIMSHIWETKNGPHSSIRTIL